MRSDELYLVDILDACNAIGEFIAQVSPVQFEGNDLVRSAVLQKLIMIGEAARRVSQELRDRHADVPWPDIVAFRNIAVHEYFSVDWQIVWTAATSNVTTLKEQITRMLSQEFGKKPS
jgi:uncharacterized protein with HEPN domain